jgi:hypothetical protein
MTVDKVCCDRNGKLASKLLSPESLKDIKENHTFSEHHHIKNS